MTRRGFVGVLAAAFGTLVGRKTEATKFTAAYAIDDMSVLVVDSLDYFYREFKASLSARNKIPTGKGGLAAVMRETRPECADIATISDEDVRLWQIVESHEAKVIELILASRRMIPVDHIEAGDATWERWCNARNAGRLS